MYAVKQVLPESSGLRFLIQVLMGCADDTRINPPFGVIPDPRECAVLQELQKFALEIRIQLRNLIQKQSAAMRHFHSPRLGNVCPGKGTLLVSKQLAFKQRPGNRRTAHLYELSGGVLRIHMYPSCQRFLARAALTTKQNRHIRSADLLRSLAHLRHHCRAPEQNRVWGHLVQSFPTGVPGWTLSCHMFWYQGVAHRQPKNVRTGDDS